MRKSREISRRLHVARCKRSSSVLVVVSNLDRSPVHRRGAIRSGGSRSSGARPAAREHCLAIVRRARAASPSRRKRCSCVDPGRAPTHVGRRPARRRSPRAACARRPRARGDDTTSSSCRLAWRHRLTDHHTITRRRRGPSSDRGTTGPTHLPSDERDDREHRRERVGDDVDVRGAQVEVERAGFGFGAARACVIVVVIVIVVVVVIVIVAVVVTVAVAVTVAVVMPRAEQQRRHEVDDEAERRDRQRVVVVRPCRSR